MKSILITALASALGNTFGVLLNTRTGRIFGRALI
jgi:hypothetical protein